MGLMSSFRKIGRAIDPTSSKSKLGGIVKAALPFVPVVGGAAALAVNSISAAKQGGSSGPPYASLPVPTPTGGEVPAGVVYPTRNTPAPEYASAAVPLWKRPAVLIGAALALVVGALVVLRRK